MNQNKTIIAFSGKRGVGKTLSAMYLCANYGFKSVSFANVLKDLSSKIFPFSKEDLYGETKEELFKSYDWTPRDFMIKFGQFVRYFDSTYWIKGINLEGDKVVIDDLRYLNEATFLKEKGALIVRLERYKNLNVYKNDLNDESEKELDDYKFDFIIKEQQNVSKTDLYKQLHKIVKGVL